MNIEEEITMDDNARLKARIERVLSEILSDKYDCNITLRFVPKKGRKEEKQNEGA